MSNQRHIFIPAFIIAVFCAFTFRLISFINAYSVNMLFGDQWDLYNPLFRGEGVLSMFLYKHGPHRQGLGGLVMAFTATASRWNGRWDAFAVGAVVVLTTVAALLLTRRLAGRWEISAALIPLIFLTTACYESLTVVPDPAHSTLPALMTVLTACAWMIPQLVWRYSIIALLTTLQIFTGFGLFQGMLIPAMLAVEVVWLLWRRDKRWIAPALALAASLGSWVWFFNGYRFSPIVRCFVFPHSRPWEYPEFMAHMFGRFIGIDATVAPTLSGWLGGLLLTLCCGLGLYSGVRLLQRGPDATAFVRTIALLEIGTLLFSANTAIGRICTGITAGQSSRYMALIAPAFLAFYLAARHVGPRWPRFVVLSLLWMILLPIPLPFRADDTAAARGFAEVKQHWRACYFAQRDVDLCNQQAGFPIFPITDWIIPKLAYLEEHKLNLYR